MKTRHSAAAKSSSARHGNRLHTFLLISAALVSLAIIASSSVHLSRPPPLSSPPSFAAGGTHKHPPTDPSHPSSGLKSTWRDYASALTTIRCFISPSCFRSIKCRVGRPKRVKRRLKWEERSFCVDDLRASSREARYSDAHTVKGGNASGAELKASAAKGGNDTGTERKCLVYSIGLDNNWEFEKRIANDFGCDVHAFDPTMPQSEGTVLAPGVTFHKLGLQGEGTNMSATNAAHYNRIDPSLLLTLGEVMERLRHVGQRVDLLVMDCEGCEWGVLRQMACSGDSRLVSQLSVEFHFQKNLGLYDKHDVLVAAEAIQCLEKERWGLTSIEPQGASREDWDYAQGMAGVVHTGGFLAYISLRRLDAEGGERLPEEISVDLIKAEKKWYAVYHPYLVKHGRDYNAWPNEAKEKMEPFNREVNRFKHEKDQTVFSRSTFDDHPLME